MTAWRSAVYFWSCVLVIATSERVEKCGLLDFDPGLVSIQTLSQGYNLYTDIPVPPCENAVMNYVNYCYNYPQPGTGTVQVGGVYLLRRTGTHEHEIVDYQSLSTDTRSCQGRVFMNGGRTLCCISQLLTFSRKLTVSSRSRSHDFGLRIFRNTYSISLGYSDAQYTTSGYNPDFITTSIGSQVGRSTVISSLLLPLVSFSERATESFEEVFCPTPDSVSIVTNASTTMMEPSTAPMKPATETIVTDAVSVPSALTTVDGVSAVNIQSVDTSGQIAIIGALVTLLAAFIIISIILGVSLFVVYWKRAAKNISVKSRKWAAATAKEPQAQNKSQTEDGYTTFPVPVPLSYNRISHLPSEASYNAVNVYEDIPTYATGEKSVPYTKYSPPYETVELHQMSRPLTQPVDVNKKCDNTASMKSNAMYGKSFPDD